MDRYESIRLTIEQDRKIRDMALEIYTWFPGELYPLDEDDIEGVLAVLNYHILDVPNTLTDDTDTSTEPNS